MSDDNTQWSSLPVDYFVVVHNRNTVTIVCRANKKIRFSQTSSNFELFILVNLKYNNGNPTRQF